jgi:NADH dehydrogenase
MKNQKICVLGGSGFVGSAIVSQLAAEGRQVRLLTRRRESAARELILLPTVEVVEADVHDGAQLARHFRDMDAVINLVGILHESRPGRVDKPAARRGDFHQTHIELTRKVIHACAQSGVMRLLHMSALGADPVSQSAYQRSKGVAETLVREAARAHVEHENWYLNGPKFLHGYGLEVTIFRPSVIFGRGDSFLSLFARLVGLFPVMPLARAQARFQPVHVEDVARAFCNSLDNPKSYGKTYDLCGPRVYALHELVRYVASVTGARPSIVELPDALGWLQARLLECKPGKKLMTRDNFYAMQVDNVCPHSAWPELGIEPLALEAVAPLYLQGDTPRGRYARYRGHAHR